MKDFNNFNIADFVFDSDLDFELFAATPTSDLAAPAPEFKSHATAGIDGSLDSMPLSPEFQLDDSSSPGSSGTSLGLRTPDTSPASSPAQPTTKTVSFAEPLCASLSDSPSLTQDSFVGSAAIANLLPELLLSPPQENFKLDRSLPDLQPAQGATSS